MRIICGWAFVSNAIARFVSNVLEVLRVLRIVYCGIVRVSGFTAVDSQALGASVGVRALSAARAQSVVRRAENG